MSRKLKIAIFTGVFMLVVATIYLWMINISFKKNSNSQTVNVQIPQTASTEQSDSTSYTRDADGIEDLFEKLTQGETTNYVIEKKETTTKKSLSQAYLNQILISQKDYNAWASEVDNNEIIKGEVDDVSTSFHSERESLNIDFFAMLDDKDVSKEFFHLLNNKKIPIQSLIAKNSISQIRLSNIGYDTANDSPYEDEKIRIDLSKLTVDDFGKYYIIDVFKNGDSCTHGEKVRSIVKSVLSNIGCAFAEQKIIPVPINYFTNTAFGDSILSLKKYDPEDDLRRSTRDSFVSQSIFDRYKNDDLNTPEEYVSELSNRINEQNPDIISTSFTLSCRQPILHPVVSDINYFAAAENVQETIEVYKGAVQEGSNKVFMEPLKSYLASQEETGVVIVGNRKSKSQYAGMWSKDGKGVNVLGLGCGWGINRNLSCIKPDEIGTSFATPEVATKLWIAKAFWRKNDVPFDAIEARKRLILASNLNAAFAGKFASAGSISINKLLQTNKGYLVTNNNDIIPLDSVGITEVSFSDGARLNTDIQFDILPNTSPNRTVRGIYHEDDQTFLFDNEKEMWMAVQQLNALVLEVYYGSKTEVLNKSKFINRYKQFVLLQL